MISLFLFHSSLFYEQAVKANLPARLARSAKEGGGWVMAGEWETSRLGDCVTHQKGFAFKSADYRPSGHPIVGVLNFTDRSIVMAECSYLDHDAVQQYEAYKLSPRDALLPRLLSGKISAILATKEDIA
jgi:hypothetical protein